MTASAGTESPRKATRVLLLVTTQSYRAGAFLEAARRLGLEVVTGTDREQALAFANPAGHLTLDFGDPIAATGRVQAFARDVPIDAVIAADDEGAILAALAAEALGLKHAPPQAIRSTLSKLRVRERLAESGARTPWFRPLSMTESEEGLAGETRFPCVLKPVHLAASRGVLRADDPAQLIAAYHRVRALLRRPGTPRLPDDPARSGGSPPEPVLLLEEYLPGVEVAVEGLVTEGRLRALAVFDKPDPLEGPTFEESIYVTPSRLDPASVREAVACVSAAVSAIGIDHGPVHAEVRINERGAWLVEIAPRSIGGLCSRTLRFGSGVSLEELLLMHAVGRDVAGLELEPGASGVMMIPIPGAGVLRAVEGRDEAAGTPGVEDIRISIPLGQQLVPLPEGARYLGFIFARGESPELVERALREAHAKLAFVIESLEAVRSRDEPFTTRT